MTFARQATFWDYAAVHWPGEGWLPAQDQTHQAGAIQISPPARTGAVKPAGTVANGSGRALAASAGAERAGAVPADPQRRRRALRGASSYQAGKAAEAAVARHYQALGRPVAAERWRCAYGEVDLIAQDGEELVFVEVKKGPSHDAAIAHLTPRQVGRILAAASVYLGGQPLGQATPVRFDVATVDAAGRIELREAAFC